MVNKKELYSDIYNRAQNIYEQYQDLIMKKSKKNTPNYSLEFSINNYSSLGGKAWSKNNLDNIEINRGVIDNFFDYFYEFAKIQTDDLLEKLHIEDVEDSSYEFLKFDKNGNPNLFDSKTLEYKLAGLLTIFVSRFIITHELGHLLNGHCEYLNSKEQGEEQYIPMFEEVGSKNERKVPPLDYRTLEMDADAFAATESCKYLFQMYEEFETQVDKGLNIEPIDLFYWWSFSIRSNFLITQRILNDEEYSLDKEHLPSVARWVLVLDSTTRIIEEELYSINYKFGDNKEKILKYIAKGFLFAEKQYNERFYTNYNSVEEIENNNTDFINYVTATQKKWDNFRNELGKFSRLPLYKSNNI